MEQDPSSSSHDLRTEAQLRAVYGKASPTIRDKALPRMDAHVRRFISLSPFFCIGTGRPGMLADVSPRGGEPGFVQVLDDTHLAFPDRPGNNRLDTLTNIVHAPAVGLLFFIPGIEEMLRINGLATVTTDPALLERFTEDGRRARSVVRVEAREVYLHCTKALKRAELWNPEKQVPREALPTFGQMVRDQYGIKLPAAVLDFGLRQDARRNLY